MEDLMSYGFMIFGLGFFIFVIRLTHRDHREGWEQRMMEAREFGSTVNPPQPSTKTRFKHFKK